MSELRATADFALLLVKAANDDRFAFNDLVKLRDTGSAEVRSLATEIVAQISAKLSYEASTRDRMINVWSDTTNSAATATLGDYKERYKSVPSMVRMFLIHDVYIHQQFPMYDRLSFLIDVAQNDPSLQCANQAVFCIGSEAKLNYTILGLHLCVDWWEKSKTNYIAKQLLHRFTRTLRYRWHAASERKDSQRVEPGRRVLE